MFSTALANIDIVILLVAGVLTMVSVYRFELSALTFAAISYLIVQCVSVAFTRSMVEVVYTNWPDFGLIAFYFGFAFINTLMIYLLYMLHSRWKVAMEQVTVTMVCAFLLLTIVQMLRYYDKSLELYWLSGIYYWLVPTINVVICIILVAYMCAYWSRSRSMKPLKMDF